MSDDYVRGTYYYSTHKYVTPTDLYNVGWVYGIHQIINRFYDVEAGFNPDDFVPPEFCGIWTEPYYVYL